MSKSKLILSMGLPVLFLCAFFSQQIVSIDSLGWASGFSHPLMGWDHLLTMLAVGVWAAQLRGQAIWMLPLAFVSVMSLGSVAGAAGVSVPSIEGIILLSCAVFSVLITRKVRFNAKINVLIVAFFAFFHGFAHGQEISTSASLISYIFGFVSATLLLHGAGILVAKLVVLIVTGLLGAIFSTTAIADGWVSSLASKQNSYAINHNACDSGLFDCSAGLRYAGICLPPQIDKQDPVDSDAEWVTQKFKYLVCDLSNPLRGLRADVYFQSSSYHDADVYECSELATSKKLGSWYILPSQFEMPELLLRPGFNALYPSINNTPGMLLSNGVGLNSPPVSLFVVIPLQFSSFSRSTPNSFFYDTRLRPVVFSSVGAEPNFSFSWIFWFSQQVAEGQSVDRALIYLAKSMLLTNSRPSFLNPGLSRNMSGNSLVLRGIDANPAAIPPINPFFHRNT